MALFNCPGSGDGVGVASGRLSVADCRSASGEDRSALLSALLAQQYMLWRIYRDRAEADPAVPWAGFWVCLSAGILLKGPIAPLLALTTCLGLVVMDRRAAWLKRLHILKGLLVTCCLVLPWAVAVTSASDGAFF